MKEDVNTATRSRATVCGVCHNLEIFLKYFIYVTLMPKALTFEGGMLKCNYDRWRFQKHGACHPNEV